MNLGGRNQCSRPFGKLKVASPLKVFRCPWACEIGAHTGEGYHLLK